MNQDMNIILNRLSNKVVTRLFLTTMALSFCCIMPANASSEKNKPAKTAKTNNSQHSTETIPMDFSDISITPHELATLQVLKEICPPMLNAAQKKRFDIAYHRQLHELIPTSNNPEALMQQLDHRRDYRSVYVLIKRWTLSFPESENKALCQELVDTANK